jgi:hypothetical protein
LADEQLVAATFTKASQYIHSGDFINDAVLDAFSEQELEVLEEFRSELSSMIGDGLRREGVGGPLLAAHFRMQEHIPLLRWRLFQPVTPYGHEGPDYDTEEDYLQDYQFVYHSVYLAAIEAAAGEPIYTAIQPSASELEVLSSYLSSPPDLGSPSNREYYWAKWLARKLQLGLELP